MFETLKRATITDYTGQVCVFQSVADFVGFNHTGTFLTKGNNTVQDALVTLDRLLNRKMEAAIFTATFSENYAAGDGGLAPYTQDASVKGIKSTDEIGFVDVVTSTTDSKVAQDQIKHFGFITRIDAGDDVLHLRCDKKKPQIQLPVKIVIFRKAFD